PNHPLGRDIGGVVKTVKNITQAKMLRYYHDFYEPQNMVLALAGKIDEAMIKKVKNYFNKKGKVIKKQSFKKFVAAKTKGIKVKTFYKKTDQVHVTLGFPAFSNDDSRIPALNLLHVILGGTMSSRLFVEVREKRGLAYMVHSGINRYGETGNLYVRAGLDKSRVEEALKVIILEFEKIKNTGVTPEELKMAQDNLAGRMVLGLEDSSGQAEWYAKQTLLMKKTRTPEEEMKRYRQVTLKDIKKVAQEVIKMKKMCLAVIGPYKSESEVLKLLKLK
ncbi:MAG: pitrilysin family protein, partial [Candidatus Magasanikbacteria bacterium]|nr:pitrilysin family protein [Candidatus Magasanikbacteria bacterium]